MEWSWILLVTVLQAVMLTAVNPAETTNNYHQIKASSRASDFHSGQLQMQAQVSTDRTFTVTRQPEPQKRADYRRPPLTINASVQRRQQHQQQQQQQQQQQLQLQQRRQQQYGAALSHSDWTPVGQSKERLQNDYQQQQVRQPDAIVTFVTSPPTTTTNYSDELRQKNHVQHLDDEIDYFRNLYPYVNASELPEGYNNNKLRNVTRTTNAHGAVDENRKNSYFGLNGGVLDKNTTDSQNNYSNRVNAAIEQNKHYPQLVYNTNGEDSDEENNGQPPQSYDFDFQLDPRQNTHYVVNTGVLPQLAVVNNNRNGQIADHVNSYDQRTQIQYRENQNIHLPDGESKSDVLGYHLNNATSADTYDSNIVYNTNAVNEANEQRINYNEDVDEGAVNNNFNYYRLQYVNGVVGERRNSTHHDALVGTDSKALKPEDGRKLVNFDRDASKNKQRVSSDQYANMNVTAAAGLKEDSVIILPERPRGHKDERRWGEIEHRRRQKPSVIDGAEVNPTVPTVPTTTSTRPLRRKVQSSAKSRRPTAEDKREHGDGTGSRTLHNGQNGYEQKHNRNDRGRITKPSDQQPSMMTTSRASIIEQDVIDGFEDYIATEEELEPAEPGGYGFAYTVLDENVDMDFGQWERREPGRTGTVTGLYRVRLPDGRTQTVKYTVSPATGYKASVTYEGVQRHPSKAPPSLLVEDVERYDSAGAETRSLE